MTETKRVLIIGEDPKLVNFDDPAIPPGMTAEKVMAGLEGARDRLDAMGHRAEILLTDMDPASAAKAVAARLAATPFEAISIGAGLRIVPSQTVLFERIINAVHAGAPEAKLAFSTSPDDTAESLLRVLAD